MALSELQRAFGSPPGPWTLRTAHAADIPRILEIATKAYPYQPWSVKAATLWMATTIMAQAEGKTRVVVCDRSVGVAILYEDPWAPGVIRGFMQFLYRDPDAKPSSATYRVVKALVEWAKSRGAVDFEAGTGENGLDLGPFLKRLGGKLSPKSYNINWSYPHGR